MVMIMFGLALLVVSMFLGCCCCGKNSTSKLAKKSSGKVSSVDDRNMYHDNNRPMSEPILEPIQYYANDVKINGPDVDYDKGDGYYDNQNYIDNELLPPLTNNQQQQFPLKRLKNPPPMMRNSFGPPNRINSFQNGKTSFWCLCDLNKTLFGCRTRTRLQLFHGQQWIRRVYGIRRRRTATTRPIWIDG